MSSSLREARRSIESNIVPTKGTSESLSTRVEELSKANIKDAVAGMADLAPGLTTYLSFAGMRVVQHPAYNGTANLNHVAKVWMRQGWRCRSEDAPLPTRLLQLDMFPYFEKLYKESKKQGDRSVVACFFRDMREISFACPCCIGKPSYCIPLHERCEDALSIRETLFREYWPDQKTEGLGGGLSPDIGRTKMAERAQMEEAIARGVGL